MPRYVYRCEKGHEAELQRTIAERDDRVSCEDCERAGRGFVDRAMARVPALVSPQFPGADRWR